MRSYSVWEPAWLDPRPAPKKLSRRNRFRRVCPARTKSARKRFAHYMRRAVEKSQSILLLSACNCISRKQFTTASWCVRRFGGCLRSSSPILSLLAAVGSHQPRKLGALPYRLLLACLVPLIAVVGFPANAQSRPW